MYVADGYGKPVNVGFLHKPLGILRRGKTLPTRKEFLIGGRGPGFVPKDGAEFAFHGNARAVSHLHDFWVAWMFSSKERRDPSTITDS